MNKSLLIKDLVYKCLPFKDLPFKDLPFKNFPFKDLLFKKLFTKELLDKGIASKELLIPFIRALLKSKRSKIILISFVIWLILLTTPLIVLQNSNLDRFKPKIEQLIFARTGQTVSLQGPLKVSLLAPCIEAYDIVFKDKPLTAEVLKIYPNLTSILSNKKDLEIELLDVVYKKYKIPELYTFISFENGIIHLESTECELVKGKRKANIAIDLLQIDTTAEKMKYFIQHDGNNFPLGFILTLTNNSSQIIDGQDTHVKVELTAEGNDLMPIKNSLIGNIEMEITQGKFYGTDLISSLAKARSLVGTLLTKLASPLIAGIENLKHKDHYNKIHTPFAKLKLSAKIKNGIFNNHDLMINHNHYLVQGKGHINFLTNKVNYHIEAVYKDTEKKSGKKSGKKSHKVYSAPLIITVSGPIDDLDIKTDFDSYLKYIKKLSAKNRT